MKIMSEELVSIADASNMRNKINTEGTVSALSDIREVNLKKGGTNKVREATLTDPTGEIKLSLWGDDVEKFPIGSKVRITNGYTSTYQGTSTLNSGQYGKAELVD
jgi:replication factor A1